MGEAHGGASVSLGRGTRWARVLLWVVPALWSTNYLIARAAEGVIGPHALAFGRWLLAALLLLPFTGAGLWTKREALRREWKQLLVLGALGMWICGAWMYHGGQRTSATNMALIYAVTPIAIAIVGARLLHEHMRSRQWLGAVLALVGLLYVIAQGDLQRLLAVRFGSGDLWIVAAAISWVAYSVLLKHWRSGARAGRAPGGHLRRGPAGDAALHHRRSLAAAHAAAGLARPPAWCWRRRCCRACCRTAPIPSCSANWALRARR
jgi:drug/metabolite transporter (DMT)-like permease